MLYLYTGNSMFLTQKNLTFNTLEILNDKELEVY